MINISEQEFNELSHYIHENFGIFLRKEKMTLVSGRLQNVLVMQNFANFSDYFKYVTSDKTGEAAITLVNKITTNHTYFMREPNHFYYFRDRVLPQIEATCRERDLRIWCAACSTGEEAYTLAILIDAYFSSKGALWDKRLLATDLSEKVLRYAEKGIYGREKIAPLPPDWKLSCFKDYDAEQMMVIDKIKQQIIFRKFNLVDPFPFKKKFHAIFCRNVMIYFDNQTKQELIKKLYDSLEPGGYLFIGHSESVSRESNQFRYVMPAVYRKDA